MTKCEQCHKAPATVFYKSVVNNQVSEKQLCASCAEGLGAFSLMDFLLGPRRRPRETRSARCSTCGYAWADFQKTQLLGCPDCYKSFGRQIEALAPKLHGYDRHQGRPYAAPPSPRERLAKQRSELHEALQREDFELAARLRDEIRRLEAELSA